MVCPLVQQLSAFLLAGLRSELIAPGAMRGVLFKDLDKFDERLGIAGILCEGESCFEGNALAGCCHFEMIAKCGDTLFVKGTNYAEYVVIGTDEYGTAYIGGFSVTLLIFLNLSGDSFCERVPQGYFLSGCFCDVPDIDGAGAGVSFLVVGGGEVRVGFLRL